MIVDLTIRPPWPSEPPRSPGPGGLIKLDGHVVKRAIRVDDEIALAEAAWRGDDVHLRGHATTEGAARAAIDRLRFVLALDDDLEPFHRAHRNDPVLGRIVKARPKLRVLRKPAPFEALAWAIIEQLIDTQAAGNIAWTFTHRYGVKHEQGPWCAPTPDRFANAAALEAAGLAPTQSRTLARVALAVARGQLDPAADDQRRLHAIMGVGEWTIAHLNLYGRGRYDVPLAKDVGMRNAYARLIGVRTGSVTEEEFATFLDRFKPWQGQAAMYLVSAGWRSGGRWAQSPHALRRR
jgi:3-methyladenine DNA glycosylase/8-oxoguanine DNA glycosylase